MLTQFKLWNIDQAREMVWAVRGVKPIRASTWDPPDVVESDEFTKSPGDLMPYKTDIRTVLTDNTVKDIAAEEDETFRRILKHIWPQNVPKTHFENMILGFPMRGYPIDVRGLR